MRQHVIGGAAQLQVMQRQHDWQVMLLDLPEDRRRDMMINVMRMTDIGAAISQETTYFVAGFQRVDDFWNPPELVREGIAGPVLYFLNKII